MRQQKKLSKQSQRTNRGSFDPLSKQKLTIYEKENTRREDRKILHKSVTLDWHIYSDIIHYR